MAKKKYRIRGKVIDRKSQAGQSGLRIEAWDKDLIFDDLVGSATTNEQGAFLIEFDQGYFKELFADRHPDLFFKVFGDGQLKKSTEDSVLWNAGTNHSEIVIEGDFEKDKRVGDNEPIRVFTVRGAVRERTNEVRKRQAVVAYDLDLAGVALYRTVTTVNEIKLNAGFEFLGETVTDNTGLYQIDFFDWQYAKNERNKADVVVYAVAGDEIIGHSRIVNSEDYSAQGQVSNLDVFISTRETATEYETLMKALKEFLDQNQATLATIARSSDQLTFTAGELGVDPAQVKLAAAAQLLTQEHGESLLHELLYGVGRQNISLSWSVLAKKSDEELRQAIAQSTALRIIRSFSNSEVDEFLKQLHDASAQGALAGSKGGKALDALLSNALPEPQQRVSFVNAVRSFKGSDFTEFWQEHLPAQPEFKNQPNLIPNLLLTQQLLLLSGNHAPLMTELQTNRKIGSATELLDLERSDWEQIISKTGVPQFIDGSNEQEKANRYANLIEGSLNAAFPTQRIARMLAQDKLPVTSATIKSGIENFLTQNAEFDVSKSRIRDFETQIKAAGGERAEELKTELKKIQRTFQISPNPEAMAALIENKLDSATAIANIPRKSFIKDYSGKLGGEDVALAIHERSSHISTRSEFAAMHLREYSHGATPQYVMDQHLQKQAMEAIEGQVPNYSELFGAPDICECEHCNSVFSPAAYYVDLLRFLWRSATNDDNRSPLDMISVRRPDLVHLPLTCENTNTIIPYIDLANEVMEYYTANGSLASFKGYDTGETTTEELRANPQNFNLEAYRTLEGTKFPFTLPYHQPLDVIRTFSQHVGVSRYETMKAVNPLPNADTGKAIAAESLMLCQEEYKIIAGAQFNGAVDATALHAYFGYNSAARLEDLSEVREFLKRSGVAYTDLVELVKTRFINPFQPTLDFLQNIFSLATIDSSTLYTRLGQITAGTLHPATDADIVAALNAYNTKAGTTLTTADLDAWVTTHFSEFKQVITLFEPDSKCDLDSTRLRTIRSIYESLSTSGVTNQTWSKIHRFIRLWRKLGWTIHETDLMLSALGETDIGPATIAKLESVMLLKNATKLAPNQLAVFWGNIDSYGEKSLYRKLFLNRSAQQIDEAFQADAWGNYLQGNETLAAHKSAIVAAFRITEEELTAIVKIAKVISGANQRVLNLETDILNIENLSTLYRYVMLAKGLKLKVGELCSLISLFGAAPFSICNLDTRTFTNISPADTYTFYQLAAATKTTGFNPAVLDYILHGAVPADSNIGLTTGNTLQAVKDIRAAFVAIEQDHPEAPATPLTSAALAAELSLTFSADVVNTFIGILESTTPFETLTDSNLNIDIPNDESTAAIAALVAAGTFLTAEKAAAFLKALSLKYTYGEGSGRLTCAGTATDLERDTLKALANTNANFDAAVDEIYSAPETFIATHFSGIFNDLADANEKLLDHPAQTTPPALDDKLTYVYGKFTPILKAKLRQETVARHIAALAGLTEAAAALLVAADVDSLIEALSTSGFSADYFGDANWVTSVLKRTDSAINFTWGTAAPDPPVPADNFSIRWEAYIAAPASGEYTLTVEVTEPDQPFNLYLDNALILQKIAANPDTSLSVVVKLNASQMSRLKLEYAAGLLQAGVKLFWKTATTAMEIVPANVVYPASIVDDFLAQATTYHRAAQFVLGFKLSETELNHLLPFSADFGSIDFKALDTGDWQRIYSYTTLRNAVPQAQALLTDVFARANTTNPLPTVADLKSLLYLATAWDQTSLDFLADTHFGLTVADFKNEIALNRLFEVMKIVSASGLSATTIASWGKADTDFDILNTTAQLLKNGVKAKYGDEDWLQLAADLTDKIRERQRDSLVAHLLTKPAIQDWGAADADGLFEYFLIDVQMGSCMDTSRIVQANASVQMFVNRCLLNLESDLSTGSEEGVSPGSIDKERWEWMKNYRVWEANRKVFVYPENWLEPEWRNDRSEFFKDLESFLVQNDLNDRNTEQAFRNYLTSLHQVANLEVCGIHRENYESDGKGLPKLKYLHVFARTHNAPYKFFYRTWNEYRKWSAWETVPVDIRCIEDGYASGVSLLPVVWKGKLILFWPEFIEKQVPPSMGSKSPEAAAKDPISTMKAEKYWEVRLAWSEYIDGKWAAKQVSKEFINQYPDGEVSAPQDLLFTASISNPNQLTITITDRFWNDYRGDFTLPDIQSQVQATGNFKVRVNTVASSPYSYRFSTRVGWGNLTLMNDTYLNFTPTHYLLPVDTFKGLDITLDDPFFFSDAERTYFVRPVPIEISEWIANPGVFKPLLPGFVPDLEFYVPVEIPRFEPDDYLPIGGIDPSIDVGSAVYYVPGIDESRPLLIGLDKTNINPLTSPLQLGLPANGLMSPVSFNSMSLSAPRVQTLSNNALVGETTTIETFAVDRAVTKSTFGAIAQTPYIDTAFGHYSDGLIYYYPYYPGFTSRTDTGLEFHTFYHPFSSQFVNNLNQGGVASLLQSDTTLPSDNGTRFLTNYFPNFNHGFVQHPPDFNSGTYYKENICFWVYGANSLYNMELFFHAPLYIATRLSKNGQYEEAMKWFHYIFDPTTDDMPGPGETEISRYWKVPPFKTTPAETMEEWFRNNLSPNSDPNTENAVIGEWRDNPFDPHLVASNRPLAYMKHVVVKYVENLLAWGDSLFRQDTMESVNEALQIYVIANHILGPYPQFVPKRGEIKAESFDSLRNKWDDFSNALVELENIFPYSSQVKVSQNSPGTNLLGIGSSFYFCIPSNDKLLELWDTVADRLFKIRHCQNIDGVERHLALFAPPIDPAALVMAASQGLSLGSILADLSSPPPIYRFSYLVQKANEFCGEVKSLGASLLSVLEKKDGEELSRLRATHETQMSELMIAIKERQVLDAKARKEGLEKSRASADFRLRHYTQLLGNDGLTVPVQPVVNAALTADSQLPADTAIAVIQTNVDESLVDSDESGVKLIPKEKAELDLSNLAMIIQQVATGMEGLAGTMNFIPNFSGEMEPFGCGASISYGGSNIAGGISGLAKVPQIMGTIKSHQSTLAAKMATYIRREQEWTLQANLAAREIIQLDKQITSADIQIQVAERELENQRQQIENAKEIELFLRDKFSNQELYQWMKEQLFAVYKQSYNLAYDLAKKAEKAYKYELGTETASFIQYSYWDNSKQGLVAGEKLQLALRQLEKSYFEENRRELELSKSISLGTLDPLALIELKETGKCYVSLPEELFDFDFPGHYFRRIKSVSISIPCIAGPYTTVNCSLHLLSNDIRVKTSMNGAGKYEHENDEGLWIDDVRFRTNNVAVTSIATSTAQNDTGLFEFNFRDERYLPFEGAGVISNWRLELSTENELRQFDYATISDVILHVRFTAKESGGLFKDSAISYLKSFITNTAGLPDQPLVRGFNMKHEFPSEWYKFLHPDVAGADQVLNFVLGQERFPFFAQDRVVTVDKIDAFARCTQTGSYLMVLSLTNRLGTVVTSSEVTMQSTSTYGELKKATLNVTDAGLNLEQLNVKAPMSLKLKRNGAANFKNLATQPPEVDDLFLVFHYKVADLP